MKLNSFYKSKYQFMCVLVAIISLSSCVTAPPPNIPNIKSVDNLKGRKMLVGRFVFYVNDKLVNPHEVPNYTGDLSIEEKTTDEGEKEFNNGFIIVMKNEETKILMLDEEGYVYIPVDIGRHFIAAIYHSDLYGTKGFLTANSGINIQKADTAVNFGTIKVEFKQNVSSKATDLTTGIVSAFTYGLVRTNEAGPAKLRVTKTLDWEGPRDYISSKFSILPELIRDETINFSKELEAPFK